jgi:hypothetical protein
VDIHQLNLTRGSFIAASSDANAAQQKLNFSMVTHRPIGLAAVGLYIRNAYGDESCPATQPMSVVRYHVEGTDWIVETSPGVGGDHETAEKAWTRAESEEEQSVDEYVGAGDSDSAVTDGTVTEGSTTAGEGSEVFRPGRTERVRERLRTWRDRLRSYE